MFNVEPLPEDYQNKWSRLPNKDDIWTLVKEFSKAKEADYIFSIKLANNVTKYVEACGEIPTGESLDTMENMTSLIRVMQAEGVDSEVTQAQEDVTDFFNWLIEQRRLCGEIVERIDSINEETARISEGTDLDELDWALILRL